MAAAARALGGEAVVNPAPERGMGSSIALGFGAALATARAARALLWPVDHPWVKPRTVAALLAAPGDVVVPRWRERGGHPVVVGRAAWPALTAAGEVGARVVLRDPAWRRVELDVADAGVVRDVDTWDDVPR